MARVPKSWILRASLTFLMASAAVAGRPSAGGGGTAPSGKIQYVAGDGLYSMNPDGTGKQMASPVLVQNALRAPLSVKKYGSGRWQIVLETTADSFQRYEDLNGNRQYDAESESLTTFSGVEVFAYRWAGSSWDILQVTETSRDGFREIHYSDADISLAWSNDGLDSFLSVRLTGSELDSQGRYLKSASYPQYIARIHLSGAELDRCAEAGLDPVIRVADPEFEIVASDLSATVEDFAGVFASHSWGSDGTQLIIGNSRGGTDLSVWNVATGTSYFLAHSGNDIGVHHHWSPDGGKIVLGDGTNIFVVAPDGTGLTKLLGASSTNFYSLPRWSPDSQWIAYRKLTATKSICRIPATGGKEVNLTKDLNGVEQYPLGWTAD